MGDKLYIVHRGEVEVFASDATANLLLAAEPGTRAMLEHTVAERTQTLAGTQAR